jgi:hypothetical protein
MARLDLLREPLLLEIRTGIPNLTPPKRPRISRSVSELEALYALEEHAVAGRRLT